MPNTGKGVAGDLLGEGVPAEEIAGGSVELGMEMGVLLCRGDSVHPDGERDARGLDEETIVKRCRGIVGGEFFEEIEFAEGFEAFRVVDPLPHHMIRDELGFGL